MELTDRRRSVSSEFLTATSSMFANATYRSILSFDLRANSAPLTWGDVHYQVRELVKEDQCPLRSTPARGTPRPGVQVISARVTARPGIRVISVRVTSRPGIRATLGRVILRLRARADEVVASNPASCRRRRWN
jgi:hypothetical protein